MNPNEETVSVSAETTFFEDIATAEALKREVWPLCETVARRLKKHDLAGGTIVLKLKTAAFRPGRDNSLSPRRHNLLTGVSGEPRDFAADSRDRN